jgi:hypothetical protein
MLGLFRRLWRWHLNHLDGFVYFTASAVVFIAAVTKTAVAILAWIKPPHL